MFGRRLTGEINQGRPESPEHQRVNELYDQQLEVFKAQKEALSARRMLFGPISRRADLVFGKMQLPDDVELREAVESLKATFSAFLSRIELDGQTDEKDILLAEKLIEEGRMKYAGHSEEDLKRAGIVKGMEESLQNLLASKPYEALERRKAIDMGQYESFTRSLDMIERNFTPQDYSKN